MSFADVRIEGSKAVPDKVYYNATIINNTISTTQGTNDPEVTFSDTRQTPLLVDTSKYQLSVENFSFSGVTKSLPLFIPQIEAPYTNINNTIYTVTVGVFNGTSYAQSTVPVVWQPENVTSFTIVPQTGVSTIQLETDYYYMYTYTHWVNLVNKALRAAWTAVRAIFDARTETFGTQCPFIEFDELSGLFTLSEDAKTCMTPVGTALPAPYDSCIAAATGDYQTGEYSYVGWNSNMEALLTNFDNTYYAANVAWLGSAGAYNLPENIIDMGLPNLSTTSIVVGTGMVGTSLKNKPTLTSYQLTCPFTGDAIGSPYVRLTQDYVSTGSLWSPIASFVIGTSQIPVRNEAMSNPIVLGQDNVGTQNSASGSFQKVLIETPINAVTADIWRGWVLYQPLTPTLSSLDACQDGLTDLDFFLYWRNRLTNALIPCRMYNEGTMSIRLLFERKK
jgi:hypothetical protein